MPSTKRFTLPFVLLFGMVYFNKLAISVCPAGFTYCIDGIPKCYAVITQKLCWDAAQERCRQLHPKAHLVVINSALENQIIADILDGFDCSGTAIAANGQTFITNNYWTSGRRISDSCTSPFIWKASHSQPLPLCYTNWHSGEPNCAFNNEHCFAIYQPNKGWNDIPCSWAVCSICEVVNFPH